MRGAVGSGRTWTGLSHRAPGPQSEGLFADQRRGFCQPDHAPRYHIPKCYRVTVRLISAMNRRCGWRKGGTDGQRTAPAQVTVLSKEPGRVVVQIVITEGRNRQIRRMCEAVGLEVARLKRISLIRCVWVCYRRKMADADTTGIVRIAVGNAASVGTWTGKEESKGYAGNETGSK